MKQTLKNLCRGQSRFICARNRGGLISSYFKRAFWAWVWPWFFLLRTMLTLAQLEVRIWVPKTSGVTLNVRATKNFRLLKLPIASTHRHTHIRTDIWFTSDETRSSRFEDTVIILRFLWCRRACILRLMSPYFVLWLAIRGGKKDEETGFHVQRVTRSVVSWDVR